jgi:molybdopterin/thiamine biosynthesis adenylyltransferase
VFQPENLGTCLLVGPSQLGAPKATLAELLPKERLQARGYHETLEEFARRLGGEIVYPKAVLGALDNIDARHGLQDFWPDLLIDGAIGPLLCQVSRHPADGDVACVRCLFRHPPAGERSEFAASRASGLSVGRAADPESAVNEDDVRAAPPAKREWLASQIGKPVCAVVSEAMARELSSAQQREHFEPSVPFVACLSASMVVAELVKANAGFGTTLEPRFQFDVLRGPAKGQHLPQGRRLDCLCTTRAANITTWRRQRTQVVRPT